jgi:hypothetical protein
LDKDASIEQLCRELYHHGHTKIVNAAVFQ